MSAPRFPLACVRVEPEQCTLEELATRTGLHPALLESLLAYGLIEPIQHVGTQVLFGVDSIARVRVIERLRSDLGVNLAGIAVILDLLERLTALQHGVAQWRQRA
jgi:DNA-binding transcriptional MerR regulator